jgi:hypothetical protein
MMNGSCSSLALFVYAVGTWVVGARFSKLTAQNNVNDKRPCSSLTLFVYAVGTWVVGARFSKPTSKTKSPETQKKFETINNRLELFSLLNYLRILINSLYCESIQLT